jgi:hypothetical protein
MNAGNNFEAGGRRLDANGYSFITTAGNLNWGVRIARFDYANSNLFLRSDAAAVSNTSFQTDGVSSDTDSLNIRTGGGAGAAPSNFLDGDEMLTAFVQDFLTDQEVDSLVESLTDSLL